MIVRPSPSIDPEYLQLFLSSPSSVAALEAASVGTTMANLNQKALFGLEIWLPELHAQRATVAEIRNTWRWLNTVSAEWTRAQGLMDKLDNPDSQRQFASQTPGAVTVEAVDLRDLISFARNFALTSPDVLDRLVQFAQSVMTNVGAAHLLRRVQSLVRGTARNPPTDVERVALAFFQAPSHRGAADLLVEISKEGGVRTHRPAVLWACVKALQLCDGTDGLTFYDAAIRMREQNRLVGRPLPRRAVGSTLLLKGLEAEVAVVLNAGALDARNLYVAMTRGSKALTICSPTLILKPTH